MSWLKVLRNKAGYSQGEVAKYLNMSQSQFSRYEEEAKIDDIPYKHLKIFITLYGFDPDDIENELSELEGIDIGNPYIELQRYLGNIQKTVDSNTELVINSSESAEMEAEFSAMEELRQLISKYRQKPNLVFAGHFDSGKTYIANQLLGKDYLPSKRQPATKLLTIVRHISEKPDWQERPVILLKGEFWSDIDSNQFFMSAFNSKNLFDKYKAGEGQINLHALDEYGTYWHGEKKSLYAYTDDISAHTAVVYIDSPFLLSCNIIDFAGSNDTNEDTREDILKLVAGLMDVLIYTSSINGFINSTDLVYLKYFIEMANPQFAEHKEQQVLNNIFILCTQASPSLIKNDELKETIGYGCARLYDYLNSGTTELSDDLTVNTYSDDDLRKRFFSFWAQAQQRSELFLNSLKEYFGTILPAQLLSNLEYEFEVIRLSAMKKIIGEIDYYQLLKEDQNQLEKKYHILKQQEPDRRQQIKREAANVIECIRKSKNNTTTLFSYTARRIIDPDYIINVVDSIKTKEEAYKNTPLLISKKLESAAVNILEKEYNDNYLPLLGEFNDFYSFFSPIPEINEETVLKFNLKSINSFFKSRWGVAAIIGSGVLLPIFLTTGLGIIYWSLTINRKQWQNKLAIQINEAFNRESIIETINSGLDEFWVRVEDKFNSVLSQAEQERIKKINEVHIIESKKDCGIIDNKMRYLEILKEVFENLKGTFESAQI